MKKINVFYVVLIVLVVGVSYFSYTRYESLNSKTSTLQQAFMLLNSKELTLEDNVFKQIKLQGMMLDSLYFDQANKNISLDTIAKKRKLVIYLGSEYCSKCIEPHIKKVIENKDQIGEQNIIYIFKGVPFRDIKHFKLTNNINSIALSSKSIKAFDTYDEFPVMFTTDHTLQMDDLFVPLGNTPEYSQRYYDLIHEKYFK